MGCSAERHSCFSSGVDVFILSFFLPSLIYLFLSFFLLSRLSLSLSFSHFERLTKQCSSRDAASQVLEQAAKTESQSSGTPLMARFSGVPLAAAVVAGVVVGGALAASCSAGDAGEASSLLQHLLVAASTVAGRPQHKAGRGQRRTWYADSCTCHEIRVDVHNGVDMYMCICACLVSLHVCTTWHV